MPDSTNDITEVLSQLTNTLQKLNDSVVTLEVSHRLTSEAISEDLREIKTSISNISIIQVDHASRITALETEQATIRHMAPAKTPWTAIGALAIAALSLLYVIFGGS